MKISELNENDVVSIDELHIAKRFNTHTVCEMTVTIKQESISSAYQKLNKAVTLTDDKGKVIFYGFISNLDMKYGHNGVLRITALSSSVKTDIKPENRVFRNTEKSLRKIIEKVKSGSGSFEFRMEEDGKIEHPVVQNDETDFQFIKRLASECGMYVIVTDNKTGDKAELIISKNKGNGDVSVQLDKASSVRCIWDFHKCPDKVIHGLVVISDVLTDTGNEVKVSGNGDEAFNSTYIAYEVDIYKKYNTVLCECKLYEPKNFPQPEPIVFSGEVHIDAVVTDNSDSKNMGRIKVEFVDEKFEDMDSDKEYWLPYRTPYSALKGSETTGFVFIPDKDEPVDVIFSRDSFFAGECLRRKRSGKRTEEVKIDSKLEKPDENKYIATIHDKQITFTKEKLELKAKENTVTLTDDDIVIKVGNNTIKLTEKEIEIKADKNVITIDSSDIKIKSSADVDVEGGKQINIKGKKIDIS